MFLRVVVAVAVGVGGVVLLYGWHAIDGTVVIPSQESPLRPRSQLNCSAHR